MQLDLFSELLIDDGKRNIIPPKVESKPIIDTTPRPYTTMMSSHLKDGSIVRQGTLLGFLSIVIIVCTTTRVKQERKIRRNAVN